MRKLIALTLACLPLAAFAKSQPVNTDGLRITASIVAEQPAIKVADPNNPTGAARSVTPFELPPDLSTQLLWVQVRNEGNADVEVPFRRLRLVSGPDNDGTEALPLAEIKKPWGRYLSWATTPPQGNPLWFDREIAVRAEGYLDKNLFAGGTIPPGGKRDGYVAFPKGSVPGNGAGLLLEIQKGADVRSVTVPLTTASP